MITCMYCKEQKDDEAFPIRNRLMRDGVTRKQYRETRCKECNAKRRKAWGKANPDKIKAGNNSPNKRHLDQRRRARIKTASLLVGDEWNEFVCKEMYALSHQRTQETGVLWHVDHVVPLQGNLVNGFHVWYNLQVIPAVLNLQKNNKWEVL